MLFRRDFLRAAASAAAATQLPRWAWAQARLAHNPFGLGVASGDPAPDGVVLWTRLLPQAPGEALAPVTVHWELAEDEGFRHIVQRGQALASPESAHSVHVEVQGLAPARWYHYRFMAGDAVSATGRTRTAPAPGEMPERLRLVFASCQRWEHGHYAAWRHAVAEAPDLVLFLGDYIYEYASPADATGLARTHTLRLATSLADYRDRYALHKSDAELQAAHAACPWAVTWDDHEVQNDYVGIYGKGHNAAAFAPQRLAAWQAFYEHMPLRASSLARAGALQLYRSLAWGRLARLHLLDARQYRDWQACRADDGPAKAVKPSECVAWGDGNRSFLGVAQEAWLARQLQAGSAAQGQGARWSVLAQQTLFAPRRYPSGVRSTDSWDGYPAARQRLLDALRQHPQRNTVLLGGDIHQNYVCQVQAQAERPDSAVLASEFCGTSITSRSGAQQAQVDAVVRHNAHVLWARSEERGYGLAELTPQRWTTSLRVLDNPLDAASGVRTQARFVVEDGRPGPQLDGRW